MPEGSDRAAHMEALLEDSVAFAYASVTVMALQIATAALAVYVSNWSAQRHVARVRLELLRAALGQEMAWHDTETSMSFAASLNEYVPAPHTHAHHCWNKDHSLHKILLSRFFVSEVVVERLLLIYVLYTKLHSKIIL